MNRPDIIFERDWMKAVFFPDEDIELDDIIDEIEHNFEEKEEDCEKEEFRGDRCPKECRRNIFYSDISSYDLTAKFKSTLSRKFATAHNKSK